ncbi:MAG: dynamin family protein [Lachnospiraceae bacterium]|nr:dynamin family protein [Lachnospiraceae bacterium]
MSTYDEEVYEKLSGNFELLCSIVQQNTGENDMKVNLSKIENIIQEKIPAVLKDHAPEDFYELYTDFQAEYEKFRDFILYDQLIGKNIVALGGGFSSGKSSFLNALMGRNVLPSDIDPATSVPTYIVQGEKHEVMGINIFDRKVRMAPRDIKKIAYGFGAVEDDEDRKISDEVTLGHILRNILFSTPLQQYADIAFSDTPGYSNPVSEHYSARTDEETARRQLNSSNYILWFVQADVGTVTEEDIRFIRRLNDDIPKLIIVSKADKKNLYDLQEIIAKIRSGLDIRGIRYVDVLAFSSKTEQAEDDRLREFIASDTEKIKKQIATWNRRVSEADFARNFKRIFAECKSFYEEEIEEESRRLTRLNTSITKLAAERIESRVAEEILTPLQKIVDDTQKTIREFKQTRVRLKELQDEFFTEIKYIADQVGIAMPEPSEIDLIQDKVQNPMQLIEAYKQKKGIRTDKSLVDMLQNLFEGIEPVITKKPGGSEYQGELVRVIREACMVNQEDIHINDVCHRLENYTELIGTMKNQASSV